MDKTLTYTLREEDLASTAGGLVNLILKNCVRVTGHEISAAKFLPDGITVDGKLVHVSERIRPGQTLRVVLPEEQEEEKILPAAMPDGGPEVLYEDDDIIAVNKPAGIVSHPSPGHYADSMANYLAGLLQDRGEKMTCRLVGRLDKETSGVLVFAKSRAACARLFRQRAEGIFQRTYLAVVHGTFPEDRMEGTIDNYIAAVPGVLMLRQVTSDGSGDRAVTHYRVLRQWGETEPAIMAEVKEPQRELASGSSEDTDEVSGAALVGQREPSLPARAKGRALVECHILTGRTHQIRVQMAGIGHPLVGDTLYGPEAPAPGADGHVKSMPDRNADEAGGDAAAGSRALLHAVQVEMVQPFTGEKIRVEAPMPEDFTVAEAACSRETFPE